MTIAERDRLARNAADVDRIERMYGAALGGEDDRTTFDAYLRAHEAYFRVADYFLQ